MGKKQSKKTKTPVPYEQSPSVIEKIRHVKVQIEEILTKNKMALAPVVTISGEKVVSRIDIVTVDQPAVN